MSCSLTTVVVRDPKEILTPSRISSSGNYQMQALVNLLTESEEIVAEIRTTVAPVVLAPWILEEL